MEREELRIYDNSPKRNNVLAHKIRIGCEYKQVEKVPYVDSTIHRNIRHYGDVGNIVVVTNEYIDKDCGVLFVAFRNKDSFTGCSIPIGQFGHYFRLFKEIK